MRRVSRLAVVPETIVAVGFCTLDLYYLAEVPTKVRSVSNVPGLIGAQVVLVLAILWVTNTIGLRWEDGIQQRRTSTFRKIVLLLVAGVVLLIIAGVLMLGLMFFTMPQY